MEEVEFKTEKPRDIQRLTSYKVWLSDIKEKEYKQEEGMPAYVEINGRKVSRVNVIASVVDKFESENQNYSSLTLDDSSGQLRLKAFADSLEKLKNINTGDIVLTISRIRNYNNETYLLPEIIKKVDSKQALLRRLELIIEHGKREAGMQEQRVKVEQTKLIQNKKPAEESIKEKIRILISKFDSGEGVEISQLQENIDDKEKLRSIIDELLGEGEAYEPRPGKIKLI